MTRHHRVSRIDVDTVNRVAKLDAVAVAAHEDLPELICQLETAKEPGARHASLTTASPAQERGADRLLTMPEVGPAAGHHRAPCARRGRSDGCPGLGSAQVGAFAFRA